MKILLRQFGNECYVWKEATFDDNFKVGERTYTEAEIISILDDDRSELVVCSACGKILKKNSPELEKHRHLADNSNACLTCKEMRRNPVKTVDSRIERQPDGTYIYVRNDLISPECTYCWPSVDIDSQEARNYCIYKRCKTATMNPYSDVFIAFPGLFDDLITVDKVIDFGYAEKNIGYCSTVYTLRAKNRIDVYVNKLGIVEYFDILYYGVNYRVMYSKKYDKLFRVGSEKYALWDTCDYEVPDSTKERIRKKIAALYD